MSGDYSPEITPAMIDAGVAAIRPLEYGLWESRSPEELAALVVAVYTAMRSKDGGVLFVLFGIGVKHQPNHIAKKHIGSDNCFAVIGIAVAQSAPVTKGALGFLILILPWATALRITRAKLSVGGQLIPSPYFAVSQSL